MAKPIEKFLLKVSVQTAIYWQPIGADGYGGFTFTPPVEIKVRWEDSTKVITTPMGTEYVCRAEVIVNQDVDEEGYLYLGVLTDLTDAQKANPQLVDGAHKIIRFDKVPMIFKTDEFIRECFL